MFHTSLGEAKISVFHLLATCHLYCYRSLILLAIVYQAMLTYKIM